MTTQTQTLADFLLARIAEDEEAARDAQEPGRWEVYEMPAEPNRHQMTGVGFDHEMGHRTETMFRTDAVHIARHDPARVLAECEAKRRIVERGRSQILALGWRLADVWVLKILALPYADHPDYREEWRP